MTSPPAPDPTPSSSENDTLSGPASSDLAGKVDDMEERIVDERRSAGLAGNADEREDVTPIESEDQAPD